MYIFKRFHVFNNSFGLNIQLMWLYLARIFIPRCGFDCFQVSDWWEEYVYLRGRSPIMVNSNYYGMVGGVFFFLAFFIILSD